MNKLVYLHELDSVRNSPKEIELAHKVLYEEIIGNGNTVVLSLNQVTDSKAFLSLIFSNNFKNYAHILTLFEYGALKVSRYKVNAANYKFTGTHLHDGENKIEIRTPAQYLIATLADNISNADNTTMEKHLFSALPIQTGDIVSIRTIYRAFVYSDPEIIHTLFSPDDYSNPKQMKYLPQNEQEKERKIEQIYQYTKFILEISKMPSSSNPCITDITNQYRLDKFIEEILLLNSNLISDYLSELRFDTQLFMGAIKNLEDTLTELKMKSTSSESVNINNRSIWHTHYEKNRKDSDEQILAEALIDISYNYVVESSIYNVAKHYNPKNLNSLLKDIAKRIYDYWNEYRKGIHNAHIESSDELELTNKKLLSFVIPARTRATMPRYFTLSRCTQESEQPFRYECDYSAQQIHWRLKVFITFLKTLAIVLYVGCITYITDFVTGVIQNEISEILSAAITNPTLYILITDILLFMVVFSLLNTFLTTLFSKIVKRLFNKELNIPELVESIINAFHMMRAVVKSIFHKNYSYKRFSKKMEK